MPNITQLASAADVSRKQVRRDLERGAPGHVDAYLAWRRGRHSDLGVKEHALARGADTWRAYDHQRRRYCEASEGAELVAEIMRRVRADMADLTDLAELVSRCDQERSYRMVHNWITDRLYGAMQLAYLVLTTNEPDEPTPLRRPADGSLAGIRKWIREGQAARQELRTDVRDGLLILTADLVYDMQDAAGEVRQGLVGIGGGIGSMWGKPADQIHERITESLADVYKRMAKRFARVGGRRR